MVTHDIGLAFMLLSKMVYVLSPKGALFEEKDIETSLGIRCKKAKTRKQGIYGKGSKRFTSADRAKFMSKLSKNLSEFAGNQGFSLEYLLSKKWSCFHGRPYCRR